MNGTAAPAGDAGTDPAARVAGVARTRLFVSHSSGADTTLLRAVCEALEAGDEGYEVLVDYRDLQAGDQWREQIHAWLAECDAAVILFSPRAVETSEWVLKEATILAWRRALEPGFQLVPVRLPGVDSDALSSGRWSPLLLGEVQAARTAAAAEIVRLVRQRVGRGHRLESPLDRLTREVADLLSRVEDRTLEAACRDHFGHRTWSPGEDRKRRFSALLARKIFRDGPHCLRNAVEIFRSMGRVLHPDAAAPIIDILAPFWVEPEAAARIPVVARRERAERDVAMNGTRLHNFTAEMYLQRAYPLEVQLELIPVEDASPDDFVGHVVGRVRDWVRKRNDWLADEPPGTIDDYLEQLPTSLFILMPLPPDEAPLLELRARYPRATFIFATGETLPDCATLPPGVCCLAPPLTSGDETRAFFDRVFAASYLSDLRKRVQGG